MYAPSFDYDCKSDCYHKHYFFTYQHIKQQQAKDSSQMFDVVMTEKMNQLYDQAQDWSKPVQLDIHDKRLAGHYKQISEFLLSYWIQNINARNAYLRELKAAKWDTFKCGPFRS